MNLLGTWTGAYKFDKHPEPGRDNKETWFTIIITEADGNNFSGTVRDDLETGGTKGEGTVEGKCDNSSISFIKQMPVRTMVSKNGDRIEAPVKHKPVYYTGSRDGNGFRGEWKIRAGISINKFFFSLGFGTKGTWKMIKK
jgi:hypothetical protein